MKLKITLLITLGVLNLINAQSLPNYVPADGIIGWYPFNGNANDESGNNNDGIVYGVALINDRFGNINSAYNYNGNGNYISVTPVNETSFTNGLSISLWVKITSITSNQNNLSAFLVSRGNDVQTGHFHVAYDQQSLSVVEGQHFQGDINGLGDSVYTLSTVPYPQSEWHHLVFVHNNQELKIYLDGVLSNTTLDSSVIGEANMPILFGKHQNAAFPYYLKGQLDDIGIWNRPLTLQEIGNLYNPEALDTNIIVANNKPLLYPNPASSNVILSFGKYTDGLLKTVRIIDVFGKEVFTCQSNSESIVLPTGRFQGAGIYFVSTFDSLSKLLSTQKLIIKP